MGTLLTVLALVGLYLAGQEIVRRMSLVSIAVLFGAIPLWLSYHWLRSGNLDLFLWVKVYSVMFCICWATWLRLKSCGNRPWLLRTIGLLLAANILEATLVDWLSDGWQHKFNALAGGLLMLALPYGAGRARIDADCRYRDLRFNVSLAWIVGYSLWNWTFVYLNYTSFSGHHTAILAAALIVAIRDPQRWLQARAATLGLSLLPTASAPGAMLGLLDTTHWFYESIALAAALLAVGWMVVTLMRTRSTSGATFLSAWSKRLSSGSKLSLGWTRLVVGRAGC